MNPCSCPLCQRERQIRARIAGLPKKDRGWIHRLVGRFRAWLCEKLGHSYSPMDLLKFKCEREGRAYTVNLLTGKSTRLSRAEITCRRCGAHHVEEVFACPPHDGMDLERKVEMRQRRLRRRRG